MDTKKIFLIFKKIRDNESTILFFRDGKSYTLPFIEVGKKPKLPIRSHVEKLLKDVLIAPTFRMLDGLDDTIYFAVLSSEAPILVHDKNSLGIREALYFSRNKLEKSKKRIKKDSIEKLKTLHY